VDPEITEGAAPERPEPHAEPRDCEKCGSTKLSITPVPGLWLQYWCDSCDHWWWETRDGQPIKPDAAV
jgi:hypothetical protein